MDVVLEIGTNLRLPHDFSALNERNGAFYEHLLVRAVLGNSKRWVATTACRYKCVQCCGKRGGRQADVLWIIRFFVGKTRNQYQIECEEPTKDSFSRDYFWRKSVFNWSGWASAEAGAGCSGIGCGDDRSRHVWAQEEKPRCSWPNVRLRNDHCL